MLTSLVNQRKSVMLQKVFFFFIKICIQVSCKGYIHRSFILKTVSWFSIQYWFRINSIFTS